MRKTRRRILITGCGASGTAAITKVFKRGGDPIGHERAEGRGMASWKAAAGDTLGERPRGYEGRRGAILAVDPHSLDT